MRRMLLILLILALGGMILQAQEDAEPISIGDEIEGALNESTPFGYYTFEGGSGATVSITMTSSDFDAYLVLLDANEEVIAEDDDSAGRLNPTLTVSLPDNGTYTIIATSLRAYRSEGEFAATGDYILTLISGGNVVPPTTTDDNEIAYGDTIQGVLGETPVDFTFSASAGDVINVYLTSDDFDTYISILDSNEDELIRNDDLAIDTNSGIEGFTIPSTGSYVLRVNSFGGVVGINPGEGEFELSLSTGSAPVAMMTPTPTPAAPPPTTTPTPPPPPVSSEMEYGDVVESRLNTSAAQYTFEGSAGDIITITLTSNDFDTYLLLYDEDGNEIQRDDDSAGDLNSRIGPFELGSDGTYTIEASSFSYTSYGETTTGNFVLRLTTATVEEISLDDAISGTLDMQTNVMVYRFAAAAGDVITLNFETESYSVYARLTGAGDDTAQQTYGGSGILGPIIVAEDTNYLVTVGAYDTYDAYDFSFSVATTTPLAIEYDTPATGNFDEAPVQIFTFEGLAGEIVNVAVNSDSFVDTQITLNAPSSGFLMGDDDSGAGYDPELLNVILPEDGTYALMVQPYITGDNGEFTVTVINGGLLNITEEPQIVRISDKQYNGVVVFDGTAGETVLISARVLVGDVYSDLYMTISQDGTTLANTSIGDVDRLIVEVTIPEDGTVQVSIEDYYYSGAIIELSIFNVE